ncbi:aminomethyl-transferring glycine dehydrogenase subunit GcvPA [Ectothiorhodospiraceae bacterium BW-2]|nr:aminomethyl-transferring glycine dehydrogenase subunit GcvPA [Ectothiorhodospiraceae bacterium BW-2]
MPFIPHTADDVEAMLAQIGVGSMADLFAEIPASLRCHGLEGVPDGMNELEVGRLMAALAKQDGAPNCFIGAGAYDHHIPAAVWELTTRGEFYSAYTPYQAEASQGTLQLIYEFQTMIASLCGLEVSNASLYDGATALAEALLMAVRSFRKGGRDTVLIPKSVNPIYARVVETIVNNQGIKLQRLDYDPQLGTTDQEQLATLDTGAVAALVVPQPNFFGRLEAVDQLTDWAHSHQLRVVGVVNPIAMALLKPPGEWGSEGADIAVGEGQPLGIPLSSGGPYLGFMACKESLVRQMPGRIVGRTVDREGKPGFSLTLQAREQHIRRSKATSNICTNQGLMATAATIYMSVVGAGGLSQIARACHQHSRLLAERFGAIEGVRVRFKGSFFHEVVLQLNQPVEEVLRALAAQDLLGGFALQRLYPELENCLLVCATEKYGLADIEAFADHLERILARRNRPVCTHLKPADPSAYGFGESGRE